MDSIPEKASQNSFNFDDITLQVNDEPTKKKRCCRCKQKLTLDKFGKDKNRDDKLHPYCKQCRSKIHKENLKKDPDLHKKKWQKHLAKPIEEQDKERSRIAKVKSERSPKKREEAKANGICTMCFSNPSEPGHQCEQCIDAKRRSREKLINDVFNAYGGVCVICGEKNKAFLAIDHINNDGANHRRKLGGGADRVYRWIRKNNFPDGFQVLCHNHNWLKQIELKHNKETKMAIEYSKLRKRILEAYGSKCACCGTSNQDVLTIDHINGGGNKHSGYPLYNWLRKNKFPQDGRFQLLCQNCNQAKHICGICPHQATPN